MRCSWCFWVSAKHSVTPSMRCPSPPYRCISCTMAAWLCTQFCCLWGFGAPSGTVGLWFAEPGGWGQSAVETAHACISIWFAGIIKSHTCLSWRGFCGRKQISGLSLLEGKQGTSVCVHYAAFWYLPSACFVCLWVERNKERKWSRLHPAPWCCPHGCPNTATVCNLGNCDNGGRLREGYFWGSSTVYICLLIPNEGRGT